MARGLTLIILALAATAACQKSAPEREQPRPVLPAPSRSGLPPLIESALVEIHSRKLRVAAPAWRTQRLCFARGQLGVLEPEAVRVITLSDPSSSERRFPIEHPRAVSELPSGSLLVVGERETLELPARAKEAIHLQRVPFFPGAELWPERRDPSKIWLLQRGAATLARHALVREAEGMLPPDLVITLENYEGGAFTVLRDGALLYATPAGLVRQLAEGKPRKLPGAVSTPWRLLPGPRIDEAYSVAADGAVSLLQILDRVRSSRQFRASDAPLDAAASEKHLALLLVREGEAQPQPQAERELRLAVWTSSGQALLDVALERPRVTAGENWNETFTQRSVAVSDDPPLVAVTVSDGIQLWNYAENKRRL